MPTYKKALTIMDIPSFLSLDLNVEDELPPTCRVIEATEPNINGDYYGKVYCPSPLNVNSMFLYHITSDFSTTMLVSAGVIFDLLSEAASALSFAESFTSLGPMQEMHDCRILGTKIIPNRGTWLLSLVPDDFVVPYEDIEF